MRTTAIPPHQEPVASTSSNLHKAEPTESGSSVVSSCVHDYLDFVDGLLGWQDRSAHSFTLDRFDFVSRLPLWRDGNKQLGQCSALTYLSAACAHQAFVQPRPSTACHVCDALPGGEGR